MYGLNCMHGYDIMEKCPECPGLARDPKDQRIAELERELAEEKLRVECLQKSSDAFEEEFVCAECKSYDVSEIAYEDDFGSMKCNDCGYAGAPGENFPTSRKIKDQLAKAERELADARAENEGRMEVLEVCRVVAVEIHRRIDQDEHSRALRLAGALANALCGKVSGYTPECDEIARALGAES